MPKILSALAALFLLGAGASYALSAASATSGTVTACVTVTSPVQTIYANATRVGTVSPKVASGCKTATYTVPDPVTVTVTNPGTTTAPPTTTDPATTDPPPTTTVPTTTTAP